MSLYIVCTRSIQSLAQNFVLLSVSADKKSFINWQFKTLLFNYISISLINLAYIVADKSLWTDCFFYFVKEYPLCLWKELIHLGKKKQQRNRVCGKRKLKLLLSILWLNPVYTMTKCSNSTDSYKTPIVLTESISSSWHVKIQNSGCFEYIILLHFIVFYFWWWPLGKSSGDGLIWSLKL